MQNSSLYCSHCGAVNDKNALLCFACSSQLSQEAEKIEDVTDGNIYAIDAGTGKKIWAFATAGPVDYTLTIVDAVIYVGSSDNNLYALTTP